MRSRIVIVALVAALTCVPIAAASPSSVVTDCNSHGQLTRHYSTVELRQALATLPADVKEYTDCYDVIQRALLTQLSSSRNGGDGASSGGSGGSFLPTPLIVVLVALALGGAGLAALAARRRGRA